MVISCSFHAPASTVWAQSFCAFFVGAILQALLALVILLVPTSRRLQAGVISAVMCAAAPFMARPWLQEQGTTPVAWFIISSVGMNGFFKSLEAANGLFPCGSGGLQAQLGCFLAVPQERWAEGKKVKAAPGETQRQLRAFGGRLVSISLVYSFVLSTSFPYGESWANWLIGCYAELWAVYLFLALLGDAGRLNSLLQGVSPEDIFLRPLIATRSFHEMWGTRWNLVVHSYLKGLVYRPLRRRGVSATVAALASFVASGLLHEYTFALHNASAYTFGKALLFFVSMGALMTAEQLVPYAAPEALQRAWAQVPAPLPAIALALLSCIPLDPFYLRSWRESGMLDSIGQVVPVIMCEL
jgi:hypothetical protein